MRRNADGNALSWAGRTVAVRTSGGGPALTRLMRRVVELHIEVLDEFRGEGLHRGRTRVHFVVTDRTHGGLLARICELA